MRRILGSLGLAAVAGAALPAHAMQETAGTGVAADGEIVVTARRQAERLQDTPVAVSAFTDEAIDAAGMTSIAEIARRAPGLNYGSYGDTKLSPTSLRGIIGSSGSAGSDPAVGYYVDDVFVGQGVGANHDLYDIERVEVLRGPQGTLFGRNTIGGVISITTRKPSATFEASGTAEIGNLDYWRGGASLSGPIAGEALTARLSIVGQMRGGTEVNETLGRRVNTQGHWSTRGQLFYQDGGSTSLLLSGEYREVDQEPLVFETLAWDDTSTLAAVLDAFSIERNGDPFDRVVQADIRTRERTRAHALSATLRTEIGGVTLTNIASYHHHNYFSLADTDRTALSIIYDGDPERVTRYANELRLEGESGPLDWTAGIYVFRQKSNNQSFIDIGSDLAGLLGDPALAGLRTGSSGRLTTTSIAAFGTLGWQFSDRFDVSLGGRYTRDRKSIDYVQNDPLDLLGGDADIEARASYGQFTPNISLRFRPNDDLMAYATVSKGFKSGGFNDALGDADGIAFGPEKLWNYELGLKMALLDRKLMLNAAAYRMKWSSIQITEDDPDTPVYDPVITNGGAAHSQGVELELAARPHDRLTLGLSLALQDAEYDGGSQADGTPLAKITHAPRYTAAATASYTVPLPFGTMTLFGEYLRRGRTYLTLANDPDGRVDAFGLGNLRLTIEPKNSRLSIAAWVKNVGDKTYITRLFDQTDTDFVGQKQIILGDPRTYGVTLKVSL